MDRMDLTSSESDSSSSSDEDVQHGDPAASVPRRRIDINPTEIFDKSMAAFRDSLPPESQSHLIQCTNTESLILNIETIAYNFKNRSKVPRLIACCNTIKRFAQAWEPFFEVTTILISSHPEYAAFAWSAVRLVFLLGSNFVTFLEKLCNMFEGIRYSLSLYDRHIQNIISAPYVEYGTELAAALSLIYTDIMEFCQQAASVFVKKRFSGLQSLRTITSMILVPFDTRFREMIERFALHQRMFEGELNLLDQKILIKHFQRFELKTQSDARSQQKKREKQKRVSDRKRKERERRKRRKEAQRKEEQKELLKKCARDIRLWLDIPEFMNIFEKARRSHYPGTCSWLLREPTYVSWRNNEASAGDSPIQFMSRILILEANPGFGKTVLSAIAIEDLKAAVTAGTYVTFFHFDGEHEGKRDRFKAWRAIVAQLLYETKNDLDVIDAAKILMDEGGSGQLFASDDEIEELLGILLRRFSVFIVLDGLDECHESHLLLEALQELCATTDTKLLTLSRPTIRYPPPYLRDGRNIKWKMRLGSSRNYSDIKLLLGNEMESFCKRGLVPAYHSEPSIVDEITSRSNGMFLWVRLLLNYVACPVLSPAERLRVLRETNLIEGLERMYECILQTIDSRYLRERVFIFQIFNWMLVAYRRMTFGEIHTAVAIQKGCPTTEDSYIVDFEQTLAASSLGLVETKDGKVQFIHPSVRDYLTSTDPSKTTFKALKNEAHLSLSSVCLSYLTYDMPTTPLSWHSETATSALPHVGSALQQFQRGTSRVHKSDPLGPSKDQLTAEFRRILESDFAPNAPVPFRTASNSLREQPTPPTRNKAIYAELEHFAKRSAEIESRFSLLGYAARYWHQHAYDSLAGYHLPLTSIEFAACNDFLTLLSTFTLDRKLVTTWVEACSLYNFIPSLQHLVGPLSRLGYHHCNPGPAQREFLWMCSGLRQLSAALQHLALVHRELLNAKPSAIWSNAIRASVDAEFWPLWEPPGEEEKGNKNERVGVQVEETNLWKFGSAH